MTDRKPDFEELELVLNKQRPSRPVLFEFYLNDRLLKKLTGMPASYVPKDLNEEAAMQVKAYEKAGYDYCTVRPTGFHFSRGNRESKESVSLNEGAIITDWDSYEAYVWPDADKADYSFFRDMQGKLPGNMKLIAYGPDGVLENVIALVGYENLCYMLYEDPELVKAVTESVGKAMLQYYENVVSYPTVGGIISNDDWGFKTQTMFAPDMLREYIFPWHKRIVEAAHKQNKYAILHSCGFMDEIIDDIIEDMRFDGKHSYEDTIRPVEEAYEWLRGRIAVIGGIDLDFVCSKDEAAITERCVRMLERTKERGGYALGTGNSVPEYVPDDHYFAMIKAAFM